MLTPEQRKRVANLAAAVFRDDEQRAYVLAALRHYEGVIAERFAFKTNGVLWWVGHRTFRQPPLGVLYAYAAARAALEGLSPPRVPASTTDAAARTAIRTDGVDWAKRNRVPDLAPVLLAVSVRDGSFEFDSRRPDLPPLDLK